MTTVAPALTLLLQIYSPLRNYHLPFVVPAGVKGLVTCFVTTIQTTTAIYHVYELDVTSLEETWLESNERAREWVDYAEAIRRLQWKPELAQALSMCSVAPQR